MWQICWRWFDPPEFFGRKLPFHKTQGSIWVFPKIGVPQNGWFIMENPIKIDDLGVPLFLETPISWIPSAPNIFPKTSFPKSTPRANVSEITTVPGLVVNALNLKGLDGGGGVCSKIIAFMVREIQFYCYIIGILHTLWILLDSYGVVSWFLLFIITAFCLTSVFPDTLSMCVCEMFFLVSFFKSSLVTMICRIVLGFLWFSPFLIVELVPPVFWNRVPGTQLPSYWIFITFLLHFLQVVLRTDQLSFKFFCRGREATNAPGAKMQRQQGVVRKNQKIWKWGWLNCPYWKDQTMQCKYYIYIYYIYIYVFYICIHICIVTVRLPYVKFEFECVALQKSLK